MSAESYEDFKAWLELIVKKAHQGPARNLVARYPKDFMPKLTIQALGKKLLDRRGGRGIRDAAREIGVSPATLSRLERGHLPDLQTFGKICKWLNINPGEVLGVTSPATSRPKIAVHFRKPQTIVPKTAQALAQMILAAHRAWLASEEKTESQ